MRLALPAQPVEMLSEYLNGWFGWLFTSMSQPLYKRSVDMVEPVRLRALPKGPKEEGLALLGLEPPVF